MIKFSSISKIFNKGNPNESTVFTNFNFEIKKNDFIILAGSNGSGKSTLLNLLAGSVRPDEGSIMLDGKDITSRKDFERSRWIARIFQNPMMGTAPELTVLENFRLASLRTNRKTLSIGTNEKFRSIVREKISTLKLGLENKLDLAMGSLSGGQRQSLALLMAIMDDTKLLLLDEPAAALDPKTSELIMQLTEKVISDYDLTALLVTHNIKDITRYGNRIIQLKEGKIIRDIDRKVNESLNAVSVMEWFQ